MKWKAVFCLVDGMVQTPIGGPLDLGGLGGTKPTGQFLSESPLSSPLQSLTRSTDRNRWNTAKGLHTVPRECLAAPRASTRASVSSNASAGGSGHEPGSGPDTSRSRDILNREIVDLLTQVYRARRASGRLIASLGPHHVGLEVSEGPTRSGRTSGCCSLLLLLGVVHPALRRQ